jgi:hypothetical protein
MALAVVTSPRRLVFLFVNQARDDAGLAARADRVTSRSPMSQISKWEARQHAKVGRARLARSKWAAGFCQSDGAADYALPRCYRSFSAMNDRLTDVGGIPSR